MSAWSSAKGNPVDLVSRLVTVESLDGHRLRARLTLRFNRRLHLEVAEKMGDVIVGEIATVVGEQLLQGHPLPKAEELAATVRARSGSIGTKIADLRLDGIELAGIESSPHEAAYPTSRSSAPPRSAPRSRESGVMPAVGSSRPRPNPSSEPPSSAVRTLWARAASGCRPGVEGERLAQLFAPPLRDSTAATVLHLLALADPALTDRLELLEGRSASPILPQLRREACACLTVAFFRTLTGASIDREAALSLAKTACRAALAPDPFPAPEVQRYLDSSAPLRDLAHRAAAVLGAPDDASRLFSGLSVYATSLRLDLVAAASEVRRVQGAA